MKLSFELNIPFALMALVVLILWVNQGRILERLDSIERANYASFRIETD